MASKRNHIDKAKHNEGLLKPLGSLDTHPDWYITTTFYAAVHWIRAYFADNNIGAGPKEDLFYVDFGTHFRTTQRRTGVVTTDVAEAFEDLKDLSTEARYQCQSKHWYDQRIHEADNALKTIRAFVSKNGVSLV